MPYQSTIKGVPRLRYRIDPEYWSLVQRLMDMGWYRIGKGHDPSNKLWGFRAGHTTSFLEPTGCGAKPIAHPEERWIAAEDELRAMRQLLRDLRKRRSG
jgi:hypothetical protein